MSQTTLFIAEKPSLGREVAKGLGGGRPQDGFIECNGGNVVTWCFGHLLEQAPPEAYDPVLKRWDIGHLPFVPEKWIMESKRDSRKQLSLIGKLLRQADTVVNAGDPDREGQLLVDEVLEHFRYKGRVLRVLLPSLDPKSVAKGLANLRDNAEFRGMSDAARARSRADWIIGMNLTRAATVHGSNCGVVGQGQVLSMGRVQTPTLGLVVMRDREIENFVPKDFFVPEITVEHANGTFTAVWVPKEGSPGVDAEGQLIDEGVANALSEKVKGQQGSIVSAEYKEKKQGPPLPHCLSTLQKAANKALGLSAQQTLQAAQSLYEHKVTTYPRSDCQYLPEEQHGDASEILRSLAGMGIKGASGADPSLRDRAWNTGKVGAHHAIIPTGLKSSMSDVESGVFRLVAQAYVRLFHPPYRYISQVVLVSLGGETWRAEGKEVLDMGWRNV